MRRAICILAALLVLYVPSIGPALWLESKYFSDDGYDAVNVIYAPVFWIADHMGTSDLLFSYIGLFTESVRFGHPDMADERKRHGWLKPLLATTLMLLAAYAGFYVVACSGTRNCNPGSAS